MAEKAKKADAREGGQPAMTKEDLRDRLLAKLMHNFSVQPEMATDENFYNAMAMVLRDVMRGERIDYIGEARETGRRQVYYLCMEFLMGRSLKNTLYNCNLTEEARSVLAEYDVKLDALFGLEPDAGLGNGGLGRLAACFLDALATSSIPAMGYSLLYEYGIFKQKLVDGWQTELPDFWLPGSEAWLLPRPELAKKVAFDGDIREWWDDTGYHHIDHENATVVIAQPYDMFVAGKDGRGVSTLRLWRATSPGMDMSLFNQGEFMKAMEQKAMAEVITQVLYPADNHREGKSLRLRQQYFLVSASVQDIVSRHLTYYGTLDSLPEMASVHINDTHPTLAIPELMRILMDECGYGWDTAWDIVCRCTAYTNHTVMAEALEMWPEDLFRQILPRIYQIVHEINNRYSDYIMDKTGDGGKAGRMAVISFGVVKMANLCVAAAHSVNGVSALHSEILIKDVFKDAYSVMPEKFTNVTNGIAHRRWLCQANPLLAQYVADKIGNGFILDAFELEKLKAFADDAAALDDFAAIKRKNKVRLAKYIADKNGVAIDPDSVFDVQVKRLHEYKRQHLKALHILHIYQMLKEDPGLDVVPTTFLFGAKSAPGYYLAKQIIRFICGLGEVINNDPAMRDRMKVVFLEDYSVTLAELLMPAADISEQISLAGTEASGTGNMKLMMNGAVTLGTMDGANVEIHDAVGPDNILIFGMTAQEVEELKSRGHYDPKALYNSNPRLHKILDTMHNGVGGHTYGEVAGSLTGGDPYMVLADFEDYDRAFSHAAELYIDRPRWTRMQLMNTAGSGVFSADRSIRDYAERVWRFKP